MKILAIEKEAVGTKADDFKPYLEEEALKVWQLYKDGKIRELYFRADQASAVLLLECKGTKEAKKILSTLPLVKQNLITFELIPLAPYPGFERLFKK